MSPKRWLPVVLLAALLLPGGCSGHFKFSDDEYRPLGDPASVHRGK
ncbi:MAG: hypothetical protein K0R45_1215 [Pseudomonas sp.]|jgi:hypothetical protein|nr:hypothetical protein [Pseudomonas sp.]